jgi:hypothetical protein
MLMEPVTGATILLALLSLAVVREQIAAASRPFLTYSSVQTTSTKAGLPSSTTGFWVVTMQNVGTGLAVIRTVRFRLSDSLQNINSYDYDYPSALHRLQEKRLRVGLDFALYAFSAGGGIGANTEATVLELALDVPATLRVFDLRVEFENTLGDRYVKEIYCLPRIGLELHVRQHRLIDIA